MRWISLDWPLLLHPAAEEQVRFFAELPESEQIAFLEETLGDAEKGMAQLEKLARAWIDGDNETIGNSS